MRRAARRVAARAAVAALAAAAAAGLAGAAAAGEIGALDLYDLPGADIVVLGEVHDNPEHHAHQAIAVGAIDPAAIVFEMLTPGAAARATDAARGTQAALGAALGWDDSGWPDFSMYYPIFAAAPGALILGGDPGGAAVRQAAREGAAAAFGDDAGHYGDGHYGDGRYGAERFGLDRALPAAEQAAREQEQQAAHCGAMPADRLAGMVEVQRLRDAALARAAIAAVAATGGPVVVVAGSGHARTDRGVPAAIRAAAPELEVLSVGQIERPAEGPQPFDLWLATDPVERGDPCAAFR